ncbi:hypothetical protein [Stenotrophomonas indicatrix]|uniref:hypothetical protein n=1 Tax=Stenotrophomonas indicatrix TaxID=2045451 RepID=UPI0028A5EC68|nr:hypothetical protein [Stenotrophomonas indicatrix]
MTILSIEVKLKRNHSGSPPVMAHQSQSRPPQRPQCGDRQLIAWLLYARTNRIDHAGLDALIANPRAHPYEGDSMSLPGWKQLGSAFVTRSGAPLPLSLLVQMTRKITRN